MSTSMPSLADLLCTTAGGQELTYSELIAVKRLFQDLRRQSRTALAECAEDEARTIGIHWALVEFEKGRMAADECYAEIGHIYREVKDLRRRPRLLRCDIAFYAALSTLFLRTSILTSRRTLDIAVSHELLANMHRLQDALFRYARYQATACPVAPLATIEKAA
jgi:hypothetical protein